MKSIVRKDTGEDYKAYPSSRDYGVSISRGDSLTCVRPETVDGRSFEASRRSRNATGSNPQRGISESSCVNRSRGGRRRPASQFLPQADAHYRSAHFAPSGRSHRENPPAPSKVASPLGDRAQSPRSADSDVRLNHRNVHGAPLGPGGLGPDAAGRGQLGYLSSPERPRRLTAYCRRRQYAVSATEALGILALLPRSTNCPLTWRSRWFNRASSRPLITVLRPFPGPSPWEARGETSYPGR